MAEIYCSGTARIRHKDTNKIYEIEKDDLNWDVVGIDERQMGVEIFHEAVVEHPQLGMLTWSLIEYPIGIENDRQTDVGTHELIEDFDYGLGHVPEPDDWLDYALPDSPYTIFMDSYFYTQDLLADHGSADGGSLLNRMIFSHQVTALEAYLGDTLMKQVLADKTAMTRLLEKDRDLLQEKFTLSEVAANPDLVDRKVQEYLRSIVYHNLAKSNFLYATALGIRIFDMAPDKDRLFKAVMLRHDCVHRNGFDKDGKQLNFFTKNFVQDTSDLIREFIEKIESALPGQSTSSE